VQLDTSAGDMVIYQVLDKNSGSLILQMPGAEAVRNIRDTPELLRAVERRVPGAAAPPVAKERSKNNGHKL
jgi:hypothetical protein